MAYGSDHVQRIRDRYRKRFDAVRRDTTRTADWHRLRLAELWVQMQTEVKQAREHAKAAGDAHERSLHCKAFGTDGLSGNAGALAISMRDAADRVAQVETRDELVRLLDRATHTGDEVLARAVARQAFDRGDRDAPRHLRQHPPRRTSSLDELREVRTDTLHSRLEESMLASAAKPAELQGMDEFACQRLLDDAERHAAVGEQASAFGNSVGAGFRGRTPHG